MNGEHTKPVESLSEDLVAALERAYGEDVPQEITRICQLAADEIKRLRREVAEEKRRSFQDSRISYRGFSYGVGSQWGIDSLRRAIERNDHG